MGPVPEGFNLDKFIGRQLNQICIGPFDLQFHFDCTYFVGCSGLVVIELDSKAVVVFENEKFVDTTLFPCIVGQDAVAWKIEASHEFSITLSGGARIRFISADSPYEDFVIHPELYAV